MNSIMENLRIPTLLGLLVLIAGVVGGVYLTSGNLNITSKAAPGEQAKNIVVTNIEDGAASISWQTDSKVSGFITFGSNSPTQQTELDDRDTDSPTPRTTHHVTLSNLSPETSYQFKVNSGKLSSQPQQFTTAKVSQQNGLKPIIGSVLDGSKPLSSGLVYLSIDGGLTQSAVVVNLGNFIIPISKIRKSDLSSVFTPGIGGSGRLLVYSENGRHASATFTINGNGGLIGPLKLDADLDLTEVRGVSTSKTPTNAFELLRQKTTNH